MLSLFSSFDMYFFNLITVMFLIVSLFSFGSIFSSGALNVSAGKFIMGLGGVINSFVPNYMSQGMYILIIPVFTGLTITNLFSVNPFNFPSGSQMSMVLFLGLSLWLSFVIFSSVKNYLGSLAHLIPEGAPIYMATILMIIEFVSLIIRPLTLSVRMMANILAGHLLMILLSSLVFKMQFSSIFYLGLNLIEVFVALIQSYIFTVMLTLYYSDTK